MRTETPSRETAVRRFPSGFARLMAIALGAVALYAVLGFFVVPPIVRSQGVKLARTKLYREAKITRVQFNPFTLAGIVEGLTLKDRDGADLFAFDRLVVNFQVSSLFRRTWTFREITIEGPAPVLRILTDGRPSTALISSDI